MTRHLKILLACICWSFDLLATGLRALTGAQSRVRLVIIYYHEVPLAKRGRFARQLDALARRARIVAADWPGDGGGGLACAITFDDAFASVLRNALPELAARRMPSTIFVPAGMLGRRPDWAMEHRLAAEEVVASGDALKALPPDLVTIGAHTVTHPYLSRIPREAARAEIEQSRATLSAVCGCEVTLLAFPYGDHDDDIVRMCAAAGYELVFGNMPRPVYPPAGKFLRGRVAVEPDDGRLEFFLKISGAYRWLPAISALKRRLGLARHAPAHRAAAIT